MTRAGPSAPANASSSVAPLGPDQVLAVPPVHLPDDPPRAAHGRERRHADRPAREVKALDRFAVAS